MLGICLVSGLDIRSRNVWCFIWRVVPVTRSNCSAHWYFKTSLVLLSISSLCPKDLPIIARTAGKLAGRSIGYVQLARGQFDSIMQQNQARQVHKELKDTVAQLEAIRHEIRSLSFMNPGTLTTRMVDNLNQTTDADGNGEVQKPDTTENVPTGLEAKVSVKGCSSISTASGFPDMHSQATAYAKLAESAPFKSGCLGNNELMNELTDESGLTILPVSAESAKLLPDRKGNG